MIDEESNAKAIEVVGPWKSFSVVATRYNPGRSVFEMDLVPFQCRNPVQFLLNSEKCERMKINSN